MRPAFCSSLPHSSSSSCKSGEACDKYRVTKVFQSREEKHMLKPRELIGIVITTSALIAINTPDAANAFQTFSNRQEWEAALTVSPITFDFSDVAGEPVPSGTVLTNGLSVSYRESTAGSSGFTGSVTDRGTGLSFVRSASPTNLDLDLSFPFPVEGIGFDLSSFGSSISGQFAIFVPEIPATIPINSDDFFQSPTFFGFLSDPGTPVSTVSVECASLSCAGIGQVNVENIAAVPEPSSVLGTLTLGFLGSVVFLKQRKKTLGSSTGVPK